MKMPYSALLVLFLSLTFFTPSTLAGLRISLKVSMVPPSCSDGSCGILREAPDNPIEAPDTCCPQIPREAPPYKPPPLYRSTSQKP
ncbi:hypothetical protein JHK82_027989 [Glycine max]|nr:hypothetical protein JHK82_027989 [Glycine max]